MKTRFRRVSVMATMVLVTLGGLGGCDEAEKTLEKPDLGVTTQVTKLVGDAVKSIGGITDEASAKAALPTLKDVDMDLGKLVQKVAELAPDLQSKLNSVVSGAMPQLEEAISKISSLDGVGEIVGPTLSSLQSKLKSMMVNDAN